MAKPIILRRNFYRRPVIATLTRAQAVSAGSIFSDAATFIVPPLSKVVFDAAVATLQASYIAARGRDIVAVAQQKVDNKALVACLASLARYAAPIVYNDKVAIELTGFQPSGGGAHIGSMMELPALIFAPMSLPGGGISLNLGKKGTHILAYTVVMVEEAAADFSIRSSGGSLKMTGATASLMVLRTNGNPKMTILELQRKTTYVVYAFAIYATGISVISMGMQVTTQ